MPSCNVDVEVSLQISNSDSWNTTAMRATAETKKERPERGSTSGLSAPPGFGSIVSHSFDSLRSLVPIPNS